MTLKVPAGARRFLKPLAALSRELNLPLYAVGGCVRDWSLGRDTKDLDLCAEGDPAPAAKACAKILGAKAESFGQFGTWRVIAPNGFRVDFARTRREEYAEPAALPRVAPASLREDLARRDFSVNAMALPLEEGAAAVDPFGGLKDLEAGVLRVLHGESLKDDPTRAFRAARYAARLNLKPADGLLHQARQALEQGWARKLSPHRLAQELMRVLGEEEPGPALALLREWGYLKLLHSRLPDPPAGLRGVEERLAAMALALGLGEGGEWLEWLALPRELSSPARRALEAAAEKRSPRETLPESAARALKAVLPGLKPAALKPAWLSGEDLKAAGIPPGKRYREILDAAAAAQWRGELLSRRDALAWLKRHLGRGAA